MKVVMWLFMLGAIGYGGYRFWTYATTPESPRSREDDIRQVLGGKAPRIEPTGVGEDLKWQGNYMSFEYPANAMKQVVRNQAPGILESVDLELKNPRLSIIAAVVDSVEKRLDEVPGVNIRRQETDTYKEEQITIGANKTSVFSRIDGTEKLMFLFSGGRLYTLSVHGNNQSEVKRLWNKVLSTFHFL